jgi:Effector-associated domain 11/SIR2-like domain
MLTSYQTEEWHKIFRNLCADIKSQQCVLLLGPEIAHIEGQPINAFLRERMVASNADDIAHYYGRDGFYLFRDKIAKEDVQREVKFFYEDYTTENGVAEDLFKQIAELPFHLVISLNPDAFLSDVCYKYGIKHRFSYFKSNGEAVEEVEDPSKAVPLLYNLCGYKLNDDSLILDYDDLFRLMKAIFGSPGLPNKLKTCLETAKTFICLGFDFDKWYSQLLLRLLSEKKGRGIKKYAINTNIADKDTNTFLVQQFGITFLGEDHAFFQELYDRCQKEGLLRHLSDAASSKAVKVIQQVKNGEIANALRQLDSFCAADTKNDVVNLTGQFNALETNREKGTIDMRDYFLRFNQIIDAILSYAQNIPH